MTNAIRYSLFLFTLLIYSCATIIMPSGGPKDTVPPKILKTYPEDKAINVSDNKIVLVFNEHVELNLPLNNISVSPYSVQKPIASILGKNVFLEFPEGLKQNTTYTVEFNNAIKDYNEGNLMASYNLTFSTGPRLDSGKLELKVSDAKTKATSDMTKICLVKTKSDFFGKNYKYVASANGGNAQFSNLTKESFYSYAFVDSNMNMTWDKTEAIGFIKERVQEGHAPLDIKLFNQRQPKTTFIVNTKTFNEFDVTTSQEISFPEIMDTNFILIPIYSRMFKVISKSSFQPQNLRLKYDGDNYENIDLPATKSSKYLDKILTTDDRMSQIFRHDTINIAFNGFITKLDTSKLKIKQGEKFMNVGYRIQKNQLIITGLDFGKTYHLTLDSQAIWSYNLYNAPLAQDFATFPLEKYFENVTITLDPSLAANKNLKIFQWRENNWLPLEKQAKINLKNQFGDELRFYILMDSNNDGRWTTGDIEKEIQPEILYHETIKLEAKKTDYLLKITNP